MMMTWDMRSLPQLRQSRSRPIKKMRTDSEAECAVVPPAPRRVGHPGQDDEDKGEKDGQNRSEEARTGTHERRRGSDDPQREAEASVCWEEKECKTGRR